MRSEWDWWSRSVIRVLIVDDHPALRTGVWSMLRVEPGFQPAGAVSDADHAVEHATAVRPDVILVDYRLPGDNGLLLCHRLQGLADKPRVLVYSAYPEAELAVPALLAGADGVVSKAAPPDVLVEAIRNVYRGRTVFPHIGPERLQASAGRLDAEDLAILGMRVDRTPLDQIAGTLGLDRAALDDRLRAMIMRLAPAVRERMAG
jgi:DNA-binding NarL/FixJ family response regulator